MTDPTAALLGASTPSLPPSRRPAVPEPVVPERAPGVTPSVTPKTLTTEDARVGSAFSAPSVPRHRLDRPAARPGPGIQMLLRRTRLTLLAAPSPEPVPTPPLVLLGRPGITPDSIPRLATAAPVAGPPTAALRTVGLRVLVAAMAAADPDENSVARRRAAATGLHPVDTSGAPVLAYRVKPGDDLDSVARHAGCSGRAVLAANGMRPGAVLKTGQLIRLPALPKSRPAAAPESDTTREQAARRRRTRRGEVLPAGDLPHRSYPAAVTRAAATNREALKRADVPDRATVRGLVRATAVHFGLDPALALAVASMESGFDHRLVSPANAVGVMQLLPSAGAWAGELLGRPLDLLDVKDNITAGVVLLLALGHRADEQTALAGYYQGLTSVRRHGSFPDTRRYVATVRTLKLRFR